MTKKRAMKIGLIVVFIVALIYLVMSLNIYSKESLTDFFVRGSESRNFAIFFTIFTTVLIIFFVPISWLNALSAFFFGLRGFIYIIIAGIIGSTVSFFIARVFQEDAMKIVNKIYNRKERKVSLNEITCKIDKFGMGYVFFMRSMPFIPFSVANAVSGVTSISYRNYLFGTLLGLIPGQFATNLLFTKAVSFREDPLGAIAAVGIKALYVVIVLFWQKRSKYQTKE